MSEYIVIVQEGNNEMARKEFYCDAESASQAEAQALDLSKDINCIAVYERIR
jgi:hypothetical protein